MKTIRHKLLAVVVVTTLAALIVTLVGMVGFSLHEYRKNLLADMATQSELLGHMAQPALNFDDPQLAEEILSLLKYDAKVNAAAIYDAEGNLFAEYKTRPTSTSPPTSQSGPVHIEGRNMIVFLPIESENEVVGTVYLRADYLIMHRVVTYVGLGLLLVSAAMVLALLLLVRLQRVVTEPILNISHVARDVVSRRDYTRRANKSSNDEVGVLVDSFNDMLAEIERRTEELENSNHAIAHEAKQRALAQSEVMQLNEQLESRVLERTTQLESANKELSRAKALAEHANQAKSAFLSRMSHDLRTPLNAILGFTQILLLNSDSLSHEELLEYTSYIDEAGEHLLVLIDEVLDLAKVESGTLNLSLECVALDEVLVVCRELMGPVAEQSNVNLTIHCEQCLHVIADKTRLKQVMLNLLSNAIKYNRDHGTVTVHYSLVEKAIVRVVVQDTGIGLDAEQLSQLFQSFNRLGQEGGTIKGTGIGLVVTKQLVELMNGRIGVDSSLENGSTFWIELPVSNAVQEKVEVLVSTETNQMAATELSGTPITLLYVEDNPINLKLVEAIFSTRPEVTLLSAADANLGIALAIAHLPDVILMDLNLPGISGSTALKTLKGEPKTRRIPVIAVTASAMQKEIEKGLEQGFFAYVTKPIRVDHLLEAIDAAIASITPDEGGERVKLIDNTAA